MLGWSLSLLACVSPGPTPTATAAEPSVGDPWPHTALTQLPLQAPPGLAPIRVALDPGHGAPGNPGNRSARCTDEQDEMMALALRVAAELEATGHVEVWLTRRPGELVEYPERVRMAEAWGAQALVSLHSDARGPGEAWEPTPGQRCMRQDGMAGTMVLWSDEGPLAAEREALAVSTAWRLGQAGFGAYSGEDHGALYSAHPAQSGVFVDQHAPERRILMLRRPAIPSVIVETYHARDPAELHRWDQEETVRAFSAALAQGLIDTIPPSVPTP